jgi:hypothetical protein
MEDIATFCIEPTEDGGFVIGEIVAGNVYKCGSLQEVLDFIRDDLSLINGSPLI